MAVTELRIALTVDDYNKAVAFYRDGLSLERFLTSKPPWSALSLMAANLSTKP